MDEEKLAQELRREEGVRACAYQDHLGYWTIGVGRLIDARKGGGLSAEEIDYLLRNDIARVRAQVTEALPWAAGLSDARQRALCNMAFQMGVKGLLGFKNMLAFMRDEKFDAAADEAMRSKWARQTPVRALRVIAMIRRG